MLHKLPIKCEPFGGGLLFTGIGRLDLAASFSCGQCFRWRPADGGAWAGVALGRAVTARSLKGGLHLFPAAPADAGLWADYFDLARDYGAVEARILADARLRPALAAGRGIRILRQEPFETLVSFILSANNNIPRIRGIVERLCALCGRPLGQGAYAFPTPQALARQSEAALRAVGAGYRAPFVLGSARRVAEGFALAALRNAPLAEARKALCTLPGVGPKVADCVALFSLGHTAAFPMDVWMKRAVRALLFGGGEMNPGELERAVAALGEEAGIVQQFIFHYARSGISL